MERDAASYMIGLLAPIIAGTLAGLLLLFGAYMGSYYVMLEDKMGTPIDDANLVPPLIPVYRYHHLGTIQAFWPAHQFDRLIRPGYWGE